MMYGRDPNEFTANLSLTDQNIIDLRCFISCQRQLVLNIALELKKHDKSSGWFRESKRAKLLEKLHRERTALEDIELAHTVAVRNTDRFPNVQSAYHDELERRFWDDKEKILEKIDRLKGSGEPLVPLNEEQYLLTRIRSMLADFIGMIELNMIHKARVNEYKSGGPISGSKVFPNYVELKGKLRRD